MRPLLELQPLVWQGRVSYSVYLYHLAIIAEVVRRGKETTMRLRSVAKGKIGPKSERLVHFGIAPLRKRTRKTAGVKPPDGESRGLAGSFDPPSVRASV